MKLIIAIVRNDNEEEVITGLNRMKYRVTKLSTTGGFLKKGNVTLMIGTEDENVEDVINIIRDECGDTQSITVNVPYISGASMINYSTMPTTVEVGGATIFVLDIEKYVRF